jgi:methionine biosynthesis protein MetW
MRFDLRQIASWVQPGSKVLDLGCGEGELLTYLQEKRSVLATGIEKDEAKVAHCIERGLSVLQGDINAEIRDYPDQSFDYVILSRTLQQVYAPDELIRSLLRVGKRGIVSFPNFSYWRVRLQLLSSGYAPVTEQLPYEWYDTPNIRVITLRDFMKFSRDVGFKVLKMVAINSDFNDAVGHVVKFLPNLRATYGIFLIGKEA